MPEPELTNASFYDLCAWMQVCDAGLEHVLRSELEPRVLYETVSEAWLLEFTVELAFRGHTQHRRELLRAAVAGLAALLRLRQPTAAGAEALAVVEGWAAGTIGDGELNRPVWSGRALGDGVLGLLVLARLGLVNHYYGVATALGNALGWLERETTLSGSAEAGRVVRQAVPYPLLERAAIAVLPEASAWARACGQE
jgi:hypothetical protein